MRVIAGSAGGIFLSVPQRAVRPTMDKVRAAIFSSLGAAIEGARVLDLFAGSGAFGIEALSRGARMATFVDSDRDSIHCIRKNLSRTHLAGSVQMMDALRFLAWYAPASSFDLVFADPPYRKAKEDPDFAALLLTSGSLAEALRPTGTLVLELHGTHPLVLPEHPAWRLLRTKAYGETAVHFLTPHHGTSATCL